MSHIIPADLRYAETHEWARTQDDGLVTVLADEEIPFLSIRGLVDGMAEARQGPRQRMAQPFGIFDEEQSHGSARESNTSADPWGMPKIIRSGIQVRSGSRRDGAFTDRTPPAMEASAPRGMGSFSGM